MHEDKTDAAATSASSSGPRFESAQESSASRADLQSPSIPTPRGPSPAARVTAASVAAHDSERANILIVDDRPDQLFVLRTVLDDLGQNIITATSGEMALKRVLAHDFAVILLDVNMPG